MGYDGAAVPGTANAPRCRRAITSTVEDAICGLSGSIVHSGEAGTHQAEVDIP